LGKYLRYFAVDFDRRPLGGAFAFAPGFVFELFEVEFGKCPSKEIVKLLVRFTEDASRHLAKEELLDVLEVYERFEDDLLSRTEFEQRKFLLDGILIAMQAHGAEYGWDIALAEQTHQRILREGIVFDRDWGKAVKHAPSKRYAQLHARYYEAIELTLHELDARRDVVQSIRIATLPGTIGALHDACGSLVWLDEAHVRLTMKNGRDYWDVDLKSGQAQFHYPRAEKGDPHGQYDFGRMYLEGYLVNRDEVLARHWFSLAAANGFARARTALERLERT
jgi:hypothetical protein